jgi:LPXTG-motif cell wall-anchored protein
MDTTTVVRVVAGVLALVVLGIIIWRRKRQSID